MKDLHQRTKLDLANANLRTIGVVFMAFVGIWAYGPSIVDAVVTWSENPDYTSARSNLSLALRQAGKQKEGLSTFPAP